MKRILLGSCLLALMAANGFAAGKDPDIKMSDGKVSIQAESVTLKQFLDSFDAATGMTSKVAPALQNEKISVRLEGLDLGAAIHKSFQGQPWNYSVVDGKITIIDRAATITSSPSSSGSSLSPIQPINDSRNDNLNPPPPVPSALSQPAPIPAPVPANATPSQPAGTLNLPPAQGGPAAPAPLFQTPGASMGAPLPSAQPGR